MRRLRALIAPLALVLAASTAFVALAGAPGAHAAALEASPAAELAAWLLGRNAGVRLAMRETAEGAVLAEQLLGRKALGHKLTDEELSRMAEELRQPGRRALAERLATAFARLGAEGSAEQWVRQAATRELAFVAERDGYAAARARFLDPAIPTAQLARPPAPHLRVSAVQYPVKGARSLSDTLERMAAYAREAKAQGSELVVFPELWVLDRVDYGSAISDTAQLQRIAREETPQFYARAAQLSQELGISIMAGSFPRQTQAGIVNTALLAMPDGRLVFQDKLYLTPDEVAWGWKTGNELQIFDAPWGRSTILICYDSQFPTTSAMLGPVAPELILVPSMTGAKGLHRVRWASQSRAVEHHTYVVVTGTVDAPDALSKQFSAQAAFLTPQDGDFPGVLLAGPENQGALVTADLDLAKLRASRKQAGIYAARDEGRRQAPIKLVLPR